MRSRTKPVKVEIVPTNARGWPVGTANPAARWPDAVVAEARRMHADGLTPRQVSKALGISGWTVRLWLDGSRRPAPARFVVRRRGVLEDPPNTQEGAADEDPIA